MRSLSIVSSETFSSVSGLLEFVYRARVLAGFIIIYYLLNTHSVQHMRTNIQ